MVDPQATDQQALITEVLGPRCDQFHAQCMTCLAWKMLDEIERLTAINRLRFSDGQWQPIETKPPGRRVLLWFPQLGYPVTGDSEVYSYVSGGWKATHWMPAPAGPTELAPGGIPEPNCSSSPESGTGSASSGDVSARTCKGGGKCPEPMWCDQDNECLWDRWNKR